MVAGSQEELLGGNKILGAGAVWIQMRIRMSCASRMHQLLATKQNA